MHDHGDSSALARWYGDPLSASEAEALRRTAQQRQQRGRRHRRCRTCVLQDLIAGFWLGEDLADGYRRAAALLNRSAHGAALLELIVGQLLMSRRLHGAVTHLTGGFRLAHRLFRPADYLAVLNRHQWLRRLPLHSQPAPPAALSALLTTAQVIARMESSAGAAVLPPHDPGDIYG